MGRVGEEGERTVLVVLWRAMRLMLAVVQSGAMRCGGSSVPGSGGFTETLAGASAVKIF